MEKTPMPIVAGILNIVSGVLGLLGFVALLIGTVAVGLNAVDIYWGPDIGIALSVLIILTVLAFMQRRGNSGVWHLPVQSAPCLLPSF